MNEVLKSSIKERLEKIYEDVKDISDKYAQSALEEKNPFERVKIVTVLDDFSKIKQLIMHSIAGLIITDGEIKDQLSAIGQTPEQFIKGMLLDSLPIKII